MGARYCARAMETGTAPVGAPSHFPGSPVRFPGVPAVITMQEAILRLTTFWTERGCLLSQPFNTEVGAGTLNPATFLRVLGPEPWNVVYVEPSVRPDDSRYGDNPNRMQTHTQLQVILKPDPGNSIDLYLESLATIGVDQRVHDVRFVEDNWESPVLGAWGLGWEVWLDGMEVTQYTYFQLAGGLQLDPVAVEITYGLERIMMALQGVTHFKDIQYSDTLTYGEIVGQAEREMSIHYLDQADVEVTRTLFDTYERSARQLIDERLPIPAHSYVLKCSHAFNVLDARGAVGTIERARAFKIMRNLSHDIAELWVERRTELEHPLGIAQPRPAPAPTATAAPAPTDPTPFLLELGFEELPPDQVDSYAAQLAAKLESELGANRLTFDSVTAYGSPRRVIAEVAGLAARQEDAVVTTRGPKRSAAFDAEGQPTPAAKGFASKHGIDPGSLEFIDIDGTEYAAVRRDQPGQPTADVLAVLLPGVIASITPRRGMRWSAGPDFAASRALRWIVALHGSHGVPFTYADVASAPTTRLLRSDEHTTLEVTSAEGYRDLLRANGVVADGAERREQIVAGAVALAESVEGTVDVEADGGVIDEVTNLVEHPHPILGSFDEEFLRLPPEVLTTVMKKHQRYVPVRRGSELLANFVTVANGAVDTDVVRAGNEAVLRARFADAAFFFDRDRERPLGTYRDELAHLVFEERAGSMLDRADRVRSLATAIGAQVGLDAAETATLERAADLVNADLATNLVTELSSLAGQVGRAYATADGETPEVAEAVFEAVLPRQAGDQLPQSRVGAVLAVADRVDQLVALFTVGAKPTGSADPYGLRRAGAGLVEILIRHELAIGLATLIELGSAQLDLPKPDGLERDLTEFIGVRLTTKLTDDEHDIELVRAFKDRFDRPAEVVKALHEVEGLRTSHNYGEIVDAYKRVSRLAAQGGDDELPTVDVELFSSEAEKVLWKVFSARADVMVRTDSITEYAGLLHEVVPFIEVFFDDVLVMADDPAVRANRLALLGRIAASGAALVDWNALPDA